MLLPFYLILTKVPIIIVKNYLRVILSCQGKDTFFRVLAKIHGNPYYEPTIMVHDTVYVAQHIGDCEVQVELLGIWFSGEAQHKLVL